ncbi:AraC family transcriptional regulator [Cupriavidus sp. CV2]|uniref:helix-turn-helix domain-containing protein n=1 Tax=Cupriavidus ulmosensis TaxID=3065913 RepID=UPI00296B1C00|nr:AraC family transcriptional regulator [Cupriavidus sp. CV2]MDW3683325.1 AraC family transcriptional regulator [Cupriavidus sp. CV2]
MKDTARSVAVQGAFGRIGTHTTPRALVEHAHNEFNFVFKLGGSDTGFRVGRKTCQLTDASAIIINPWMPHAKLASEAGPTTVFTVLLHPAWLGDLLKLGPLPLVRLFGEPCVALTADIQSIVFRLSASMNSGALLGEAMHEGLVGELAIAVTDTYAASDMRTNFHRRDRPMDARISRAAVLIKDQAKQNPNLDDIAAQVGLSRSRFFEQFKACVGASPQQFMDWARMAVATRLLAETKESVAEVSDELGFAAPSHFARFFAQHMGVPPGEFKRGVISE